MEFGPVTYGFGFLAGGLSTLSPCVLPLVPILLASAADAHPRASWALAAGLVVSYASLGTALAWAGAAVDIDPAVFRTGAAALMGLMGMVLLSASLQQRLSSALSVVGDSGAGLLERVPARGLASQFLIGLLLGVVWSPCAGPVLGSTIVLASQGSHLPQAALLMGSFGLGAAAPLVLLAQLSRVTVTRLRGGMVRAGKAGKTILGVTLIAVASAIVSGADKALEALVVDWSPAWLTALTTRL